MTDRVEEIIDSVEGGVAKSINDIISDVVDLESEPELTKEELSDIDDAIFTCDMCGWTMPVDDREDDSDLNVCRECYQDGEDD